MVLLETGFYATPPHQLRLHHPSRRSDWWRTVGHPTHREKHILEPADTARTLVPAPQILLCLPCGTDLPSAVKESGSSW
ncbi:hypothetical protein Mapa_008474 [Marchantia paleacea]|nr:hypothetical protein Mapa_008474 [Marchantia paleacea]